MRIRVETPVSPKVALAEGYLWTEIAMTRAIHAAGRELQTDLRGQVMSAGLGRGIARALRFDGYPRGTVSLNAAAMVSTRAPKIMDAFDRGAVIRSTAGLWLAIPTKDAPKRGIGGKRLTPSNFPEAVYGPLRFVYRRAPAPSLLVVDNLRYARSGRVSVGQAPGLYPRSWPKSRRQTRIETGAGRVTVPMFLLYPSVKMPKKLDVLAPARQAQADVPRRFGIELAAVARAARSRSGTDL